MSGLECNIHTVEERNRTSGEGEELAISKTPRFSWRHRNHKQQRMLPEHPADAVYQPLTVT